MRRENDLFYKLKSLFDEVDYDYGVKIKIKCKVWINYEDEVVEDD